MPVHNVRLAYAGWSGDKAVAVLANPFTGRQGEQDRLVKPAWMPEVDIFHGGWQAQGSCLHSASHASVLAYCYFTIYQHSEALFKG
jgi:hypothetical protein